MRRYSTFLVPLLALSFLWMFILQPVSAQEITSTPEPPGSVPAGTEFPVAVTPAAVGIFSPEGGADLSGVVDIRGTTLSAWDLSFSYLDDPTGTWFSLAQSGDPISDGSLVAWDTTAITDGAYVLRLHVSTVEAEQDFKVEIRVRNNALVEIATPTLTPTVAPAFTAPPVFAVETIAMATFTPAVSPTMPAPLPPNPATLKPQEIAINFGKGVLAVTALFAFFGLLLTISRKIRT